MTHRNTLLLNLVTRAGASERRFEVEQAVIAGWTSRDVEAMEKHIRELEEIGVPRPASTPIYYRVGAARITGADAIEAAGGDSSGEVEFVMFNVDGRLWIGVGSDHTDRKVETYNITVSKQMCDKPVASTVWPWDELVDHWESLVLRSHIVTGGKRELYQEGSVAAMRAPLDLIERYEAGHGKFTPGTVMFGGTLAAKGGIRPADRFEFELVDATLNRRIAHAYGIDVLPIAG
ncbi:MAG: DUF2848 domain-containing protein [Burkholderiaceae bacterium]